MPTTANGVVRFNVHDDADMAVLIKTGLIWKGGPDTINLAVEYLKAHPAEVNDMVPADVKAELDAESPAEDTTEPTEEPGTEAETPAEDTAEGGQEEPVEPPVA